MAMKHLFLLSFGLLLSIDLFAKEDFDLKRNEPPAPTYENLRWLMPADSWYYYKAHIATGRFFKVKTSKTKDENELPDVSIYKNKELSGPPEIIVSNGTYSVNGTDCTPFPVIVQPLKREENILVCGHSLCKPYKDKKTVRLSFEEDFIDKPKIPLTLNNCPVNFDYVLNLSLESNSPQRIYDYVGGGQNAGSAPFYLFSYNSISADQTFLETTIENKKYYIDIRFCKKDPAMCEAVEIKESDFVKDWKELKEHQAKKDIEILNILIDELKPCVAKKDIACIKKYFISSEDDFYDDQYQGYAIQEIKVDDELLKELTACLSYDSLLPHLYGTKGIKKVCAFQRRGNRTLEKRKPGQFVIGLKLMGVTYPEAIRIRDGKPMYLKN